VLPTKFRFIWLSSHRGKDFHKSTNQKQELPVAVMFVNGSEINKQLNRGLSKDASYQIFIHLAKRFQRLFSSPCQRQCELLPSLGVHRPLTFHILIFSSETPQPNEVLHH
jgi:hypothetical protein